MRRSPATVEAPRGSVPRRLRFALAAVLSGLALPGLAADLLLSRQLACEREALPRAQAICRALEREMQWEWFGHAIVAPGYRVSFASVRRAWCRLQPGADDTAVLVGLVLAHRGAGARELQIGNGARWLLLLLGPLALASFPPPERFADAADAQAAAFLTEEIRLGIGDPATIWHRANPHYLLREGCNA